MYCTTATVRAVNFNGLMTSYPCNTIILPGNFKLLLRSFATYCAVWSLVLYDKTYVPAFQQRPTTCIFISYNVS